MKYPHVMVDIETLGTAPGCVIMSIGAVPFKVDRIYENDAFYREVYQYSCINAGLTVDEATRKWWGDQDDTAAGLLTRTEGCSRGPETLPIVLGRLAQWLTDRTDKNTKIWCQGASFDFPILAAAYRAVGADVPWHFYQEVCARSLWIIPNRNRRTEPTVAHNALADAIAQAKDAAALLLALRCAN